jgi:ferritin-like metal-binding protein YciE
MSCRIKNPKPTKIMASVDSLKDLLIDELKDLYSAEQQLVKALPKMAKAASNQDLRNGFNEHFAQTKEHVERLEQAFSTLGEKPRAKTCKAMQGLIEEGSEAIELEAPDAVRDACLIGAAQRVEHYEIAAYGTVRAFATTIGEEQIANLLGETLNEESDTDKKLTTLAASVNAEANSGSGDDSDEVSSQAAGRSRSRR